VIEEGSVAEELRTGGPGEDRLAKCDLDVGNLRLRENLLAAHGRVFGVLVGECPGHHAHPKEKGSGFLSDLGEADRVNARPSEANGIKVLIDLST
jgi:hypothetical protein